MLETSLNQENYWLPKMSLTREKIIKGIYVDLKLIGWGF